MITFTGERYITIGIQNEIPVEIQAVMWGMIDDNKRQGKILDYLQVFELQAVYKKGERVQAITHRQEQPRRKKTIIIKSVNPITAKVFVIDDISHVTMLLNHEY